MSTHANRRQPVAQGGLFSSPKADFSRETHELLKVMMQESKLTSFQQRQLNQTLRSGQSLPLRCHPSSSRPDGYPMSRPKKTSSQKVKTPKQSGLRTKETIESMTDKEPKYRPQPSRYNSTKEKEKLQNMMTFGCEVAPKSSLARPQPEPEDGTELDRFDEVLKEIDERKEFLEEMEALGQGKNYRTKLMTEISQKIHELEKLDKERTAELTKHPSS